MDGYQGTAIRQPPAMTYLCAGMLMKMLKSIILFIQVFTRLWRRESIKT